MPYSLPAFNAVVLPFWFKLGILLGINYELTIRMKDR